MKQIKLVVLDIDGTIVGKNKAISPPVRSAITAVQSLGVQVALATGRMYRAALPYHHAVNSRLPLIAYQGALLKDPADGRVLMHLPVPIERTREVIPLLDGEGLVVHVYINDALYVRAFTEASRRYGERTGVEPQVVGDLNRVLTAEPTKILGLSDSEAETDRVLAALGERYRPDELYLTKSDPTFVEVTNPLVNKGRAVRFLAEDCLGLVADEVLCVGDQFNDLEMITYAGTGVAMGNAPDAVRSAANWVAPTVEEDGVAAALEKFVLIPGAS